MTTEARDEAKQKKHLAVQASLDAQDEIIIYAAIGRTGPRGDKTQVDMQWPLSLDIIAWRIPDGPVQRGDLFFEQRVTEAELAALQGTIPTQSLIAIRAKLCECSHFGDTRARFLGLLATPCDDKLAAILFDYCNPVVMVDPQLGRLVFDKAAEEYTGRINWLGNDIRIDVATDEDGSPADALATLKILMSDMAAWTHKVKQFAVAELLELKNEGWLCEGEAPVTHAQFSEQMQFDCLSVDPGGAFTFWHLDGGLFSGHHIQICGSLEDGLTDADIPG
jgi:hypothetical protein